MTIELKTNTGEIVTVLSYLSMLTDEKTIPGVSAADRLILKQFAIRVWKTSFNNNERDLILKSSQLPELEMLNG